MVYANFGARTALFFYSGQTGSQFQVRYKEHALAYKNNYNSAYAKHLISYGNSLVHMEDIMDIIFTKHKGNTLILLKMSFISGNF